jgi:membrane protease subunit (stomatin/prohibitin family)
MVQDLLWRTLSPESIVMTRALNDAIAEQEQRLGVSTDGCQVVSISVTHEAQSMYAELGYARTGIESQGPAILPEV